MKDKEKITTELKSTIKNLKIYNTIGGIAIGVGGFKFIDSLMTEDISSASVSLALSLWVGCAYYIINKSLNKDVDKSISEINNVYDEYIDLDNQKKKTNDSEKVNNGKIIKKTIKHREQL